jgi:hypothetical protein
VAGRPSTPSCRLLASWSTLLGMVAAIPRRRRYARLFLDVYALSARTRSDRVLGRPPPTRGTRMPCRTAMNCGLSPRCPAVAGSTTALDPAGHSGAVSWSGRHASDPMHDRLARAARRLVARAAPAAVCGHLPHAGVARACTTQSRAEPTCRLAAIAETARNGLPRPIQGGHVPPRRTHPGPPPDTVDHCRFVHFGGRSVNASGSNGSSNADCASVRSNRLVTAM